MKTRSMLGALTLAAATLLSPTIASAAPTTVTVRVEGPTSTLFEGPVTTDVRAFRFTGDAPHTCDGTAANGGQSAVPVVTSGAAVAAAIDGGLSAQGKWFDGFGPAFDAIAGTPVAYDPVTFKYLVEFYNGKATDNGACAQPVQDGDEVLLAWADYGQSTLLRLTAPATAAPGSPVTAKVTNSVDGAPVAGAVIEGRTSAADGTIVLGPYAEAGPRVIKAEKADYVRSNARVVCVTTGADGACGTARPVAAPESGRGIAQPGVPAAPCTTLGNDGRCGTKDSLVPTIRLKGIEDGKRYTRTAAPRELAGTAGNFAKDGTAVKDPAGLKDVRVRLTRYWAGRCWTWSGTRERFVEIRSCGIGRGPNFSVGNDADWSYLLPARLPVGKYRVESFAVDGRGVADKTRVKGVNHVVFTVR